MPSLMHQLCKMIREAEETPYAIARDSGVDKGQLSRVLSGKTRSFSMESAEKLADYFGLEITLRPKGRKARKR